MNPTMLLAICENRLDRVEGDFLLKDKHFTGVSDRNRIELPLKQQKG